MRYKRFIAFLMMIMLLAGMVPGALSDENTPTMGLPEELIINKGAKFTLEPWFTPDGFSEKVTWETSDEDIAAVTKKGRVKGIKIGECEITATSASGLTAVCSVKVVHPVRSVSLDRTSVSLGLERSVQLNAAVKPKKAYNKAVSWKTSDPDVAVVDQSGLVTATGKGKATITVTTDDGKKTAKCAVTVKNVKPRSIETDELFITLNPGETHKTEAKVKPAQATDTGIIFESSDEKVAAVDKNGLITAASAGRATITMTAAGKKSVKEKIQVCVVEKGSGRMAGLIIGINPGHQTTTITKLYPIAPGSKQMAYGCKVGASGKWTRVPEYETNLQISLMLRDMLEAEGATVVMTRTKNDVSIHNIKRAKMLNKANVDIALQMHCNSWTDTSKNGLSVYRKTTGDWKDEELAIATLLTEGMEETTGAKNLGVKINNGYMSLNWSTTPSVLLEVGYLSNKKEDKLLATDKYRRKVAQGIYDGLAAYFGR